MKKIVKYMALFAIIATAAKCFVDAFTPEYEQWKEKYPPEPEEEDEEEPSQVAGQVVQASELFKSDLKDKED